MRLLTLHSATMLLLFGSACSQPKKSAEVIDEQSRDVRGWSVQLVERTHGPRDSDALLLDLIAVEPTGTRRLLAKNLIGPVILFEEERKIVSCEANDVLGGDHPIVIDLEGHQVDAPKHPGYLRSCDRVEDSNLVALVYSLVRNDMPYNIVRVVNTDGQVVLDKELSDARTVEVRSASKTFQIHVPKPELPG